MKLLGLIQVCILLVGSAAVAAPTRVFPGARWEEAIPESQGVDAKRLEAATRLLAATVGSNGVQELVIIRHSRMIWSRDHAKTWTLADWMFAEFGLMGFVNFGRNYAGARDGFVYTYSHDNPHADTPADRFVMMRAPKGWPDFAPRLFRR